MKIAVLIKETFSTRWKKKKLINVTKDKLKRVRLVEYIPPFLCSMK